MLGLGWLTLKQAQDALKNGRLEEALRLLSRGEVKNQKRSRELKQLLLQAYVERGEKHLRRDDPAAAWADLFRAEQLNPGDTGTTNLRNTLTRLGLAEVRALIETSEPVRALEAIKNLRDKGVKQPELGPLEEGCKDWILARECSDRGDFSPALEALQRAQRLLGSRILSLEQFVTLLEQRQALFSSLLVEVHQAALEERWQIVLQLSEKILAIAPAHAEARKLRSRAWKAVEPATVAVPSNPSPKVQKKVSPSNKARRFILWIDGVGGFLVCLGSKLSLGQSLPDSEVDIPLVADVSRTHATLTRDTEGYVLEGVRPVFINTKEVDKVLLKSGDRFTLGTACQLQFRQDVPISTTARLDIVSGLRFGLPVDGIILMAETLVLGAGKQVHIYMPDLKQPVILYRNREELGIKASGNLLINGNVFKDRAVLEPGCSVQGSDFSLTLESIQEPVEL